MWLAKDDEYILLTAMESDDEFSDDGLSEALAALGSDDEEASLHATDLFGRFTTHFSSQKLRWSYRWSYVACSQRGGLPPKHPSQKRREAQNTQALSVWLPTPKPNPP